MIVRDEKLVVTTQKEKYGQLEIWKLKKKMLNT